MAAKPTAKRKPTARANPVSQGEEKSINIRKIENGYIIRESSSDSKGNYKSTERYCPTCPTIAAPKAEAKKGK